MKIVASQQNIFFTNIGGFMNYHSNLTRLEHISSIQKNDGSKAQWLSVRLLSLLQNDGKLQSDENLNGTCASYVTINLDNITKLKQILKRKYVAYILIYRMRRKRKEKKVKGQISICTFSLFLLVLHLLVYYICYFQIFVKTFPSLLFNTFYQCFLHEFSNRKTFSRKVNLK